MEGNEETPLLREEPTEETPEGETLDSQKPTSRLIIYGSFMGKQRIQSLVLLYV
jgi:hypothetical protein